MKLHVYLITIWLCIFERTVNISLSYRIVFIKQDRHVELKRLWWWFVNGQQQVVSEKLTLIINSRLDRIAIILKVRQLVVNFVAYRIPQYATYYGFVVLLSLFNSHRPIHFFSARCNIYISRLCYDASPSVRLSVTEVYWRIIANFGLKFRFHFTAHCGRRAAGGRRAARRAAAVLLAGESSRAMLASAKLSCLKSICLARI